MNVKSDPEWDAATPYNRIPGPSKYALICGFAPGGNFYLGESFRDF